MNKKIFLKPSFMFSKVYKHGKFKTSNMITVYVLKNYKKHEKSKLGISVSAKLGGAVQRNRVKRLVRESFYKLQDRLLDGNIIVVMTRKPCYDSDCKMQKVYLSMEYLFKQMNLFKP